MRLATSDLIDSFRPDHPKFPASFDLMMAGCRSYGGSARLISLMLIWPPLPAFDLMRAREDAYMMMIRSLTDLMPGQ